MGNTIPTDKIPEILEHLSSFVTQQRLDLMAQVMAKRTRNICVALEDIYQPHNVSAVLRSCDCFGIQDVHIVDPSNTFKDRKTVSLGAAKWLTTTRYRDGLDTCVTSLKQRGYRILASTLRPGATTVQEVDCDQKIAVFFGNEEEGLSKRAHDLADEWITMPMVGFTQSFNISVTVALMLQRLTDHLQTSSDNWHLSLEEQQSLTLEWLLRDVRGSEKVVRRYLAEHSA